jgi:hypothetical protein
MIRKSMVRTVILSVLLLTIAGGCTASDPGSQGGVLGEHAVISGGSENAAPAMHATVGGGSENVAGVEHATVSGGVHNTASATRATISGGYNNRATYLDSTIGGGAANTASGTHATVGGGSNNVAAGRDDTVSGGYHNTASGGQATVGGGTRNLAEGFAATVGGGNGNVASGVRATVGGGLGNHAGGIYAAIPGGHGNRAGGAYAAVLGGFFNQAGGDYSLASGRRAQVGADHDGTFVHADASDFDFRSAAANEFAARSTGGVRFVTGIDQSGLAVAGVVLAPGSGSWSSLSDRALKENFAPVDGARLLARLDGLDISTWNYVSQGSTVRHVGPTAQDFHAAFGVGEDERHISGIDADGVALAAAQALVRRVQEQEARIAALERANRWVVGCLLVGIVAVFGAVLLQAGKAIQRAGHRVAQQVDRTDL